MKILIIGATSAIAKSTARIYAEAGHEFFLVGRDQARIEELAADLKIRGASSTECRCVDLSQNEQHASIIDAAWENLEAVDIVLICHGTLPDQAAAESDFALAVEVINLNGLSFISLLTLLSARMTEQGQGTLAVITSVAGDRGRQPNFVYGAAKSLLSTYLQGLRGKLFPAGVHVLDIRPGLVDSPMTAQFDKGLLWSSPERVARKIVKSIRKKKNVIYAPGYWRLIMFVVRCIPEVIFKRLKF